MPFNPNDLKKGSLFLTQSRRVIRFMFNPTSIGRSHAYNWNRVPVPGRSHPFYSGGSGDAESISLQLYLDADRGRSDFRQKAVSFDADLISEQPISIEPELNDLRSLVLPYDADLGAAFGVPETVILRYGDTVRAAECIVLSVQEDILMVTKRLEPYRALVNLELEVVEAVNNTTWLFSNTNPVESFADQERLGDAGSIDVVPLSGRDPEPGGLGGIQQ